MRVYGQVDRGTVGERGLDLPTEPASTSLTFAQARQRAAEAARRQEEARAAQVAAEAAREQRLAAPQPEPEPVADAKALQQRRAQPRDLADFHVHNEHCVAWPPHGGTWPAIPEQRDPMPAEVAAALDEDPEVVDQHLAAQLPDLADDPDDLTASDPVEKEEATPELAAEQNDTGTVEFQEATPVHALATSTAARDQLADARLDDHLAVSVLASNPTAGATLHVTGPVDDVERLVQRVQQYRPTDPESSPQPPASRPLTVRCALCRRPVRHDPGQAAAALTAHYTDQHPGGR